VQSCCEPSSSVFVTCWSLHLSLKYVSGLNTGESRSPMIYSSTVGCRCATMQTFDLFLINESADLSVSKGVHSCSSDEPSWQAPLESCPLSKLLESYSPPDRMLLIIESFLFTIIIWRTSFGYVTIVQEETRFIYFPFYPSRIGFINQWTNKFDSALAMSKLSMKQVDRLSILEALSFTCRWLLFK
jgi:hypothetical protein